jgi:hypothetical protein
MQFRVYCFYIVFHDHITDLLNYSISALTVKTSINYTQNSFTTQRVTACADSEQHLVTAETSAITYL